MDKECSQVVKTGLGRRNKGLDRRPNILYPASPHLVLLPNFRPMSMIWDPPLTAAVARELDARLSGARLRGHRFDWDNRELTLFFRSWTLRWRLHPRQGWVTLGPPREPPEDSRPLAAELKKVQAPPDERLIRFFFQKVRGQVRSVQIVVELMTNQWNALLLEGEEEWIRHLLWTRQTEGRSLVVGRAYQPPPPSTRAGADAPLSELEWQALVAHSKTTRTTDPSWTDSPLPLP